MSDNLCVSTAEAARLLGVTSRTIYGFINDGSLAAYRMGRVTDLSVFRWTPVPAGAVGA